MPRAVLLAAIVASVALQASHAQDSLGARIEGTSSPVQTTTALRELDEHLRANPRDAAAWHRRGILAWNTARAEQRAGIKRESDSSLTKMADTSLRRALSYAADNPRYLVDHARILLGSRSAATRGRAHGMFGKALKRARQAGDSALVSESLDGLGIFAWRRYENVADRHIYSATIEDPKTRWLIDDPRAIEYFIENLSTRVASKDWSGQREYGAAWTLFRDAVDADPENALARKHLYMMLVERQRWEELHHEALLRLREASRDPLAWMARGLASHRLRDERDATVAFDSSLALLPPDERAHYDHLARILNPSDSAGHMLVPAQERSATERMYWLMSDPLWLTPGNEHRLEFLSRVAYAELQWNSEDYDLRGADTDRGVMHVRYGPPPAVISFPPNPDKTRETRIRLLWWYREGVAFVFRMLPGYGTARLDGGEAREARFLRDTVPVVWTNLGVDSALDTIRTQIVRFRAAGDSADIFVVGDVPLDALVRGIDLAKAALRVDFQVYNWRAERVLLDSSRQIVDIASAAGSSTRAWRKRLQPGTFLYRVEALQPDAMRGARASGRLEIVSARAFGMSDVLMAERLAPKPGTAAARWSDFSIVPSVGTFRQRQPFALLWETYGLASRKESSRYQIAISLAEQKPSGIARLGAAIIGGVRVAVGRSSRGQGRVTLNYEREVPAGPVTLDYVTIDPGTSPAGTYVLSVEVTDLVANQRVKRESTITILE